MSPSITAPQPDIGAGSSSSLHLNFSSSAYGAGVNSRSTSKVSVHPAALFSILDHYLRRNDPETPAATDADGKKEGAVEAAASTAASTSNRPTRVIGTLLGVHSENEVEIRSCFAVPHHETDEQVQVDMHYHKAMLELHSKVHPEEVIVGWYATSPQLNAYSALIQDFYTTESAPYQAVHLTIDTDLQSKGNAAAASSPEPLGVRAYVSAPLGLTPKAESAVFLPLPVTLLSSSAERPALSLLASQTTNSQLNQQQPSLSAGQVIPDLTALTQALQQIQGQLRRVLVYVRDVLEGKTEGDEVVGRYLLDTIARIPIGASSAEGKEVGEIWNSCLQVSSQMSLLPIRVSRDDLHCSPTFSPSFQDVLMVSYLSNIVRAQAEVAGRLTLLS